MDRETRLDYRGSMGTPGTGHIQFSKLPLKDLILKLNVNLHKGLKTHLAFYTL